MEMNGKMGESFGINEVYIEAEGERHLINKYIVEENVRCLIPDLPIGQLASAWARFCSSHGSLPVRVFVSEINNHLWQMEVPYLGKLVKIHFVFLKAHLMPEHYTNVAAVIIS